MLKLAPMTVWCPFCTRAVLDEAGGVVMTRYRDQREQPCMREDCP